MMNSYGCPLLPHSTKLFNAHGLGLLGYITYMNDVLQKGSSARPLLRVVLLHALGIFDEYNPAKNALCKIVLSWVFQIIGDV
jgi:hypothetical protein